MIKLKEKLFDTRVNQLSNLMSWKRRLKLFRKYGLTIGNNSCIRKYCFFESNRVIIGNNTFINSFCQFYTGAGENKIVVGDNVQLGGGVVVLCTNHHIGPSNMRAGAPNYKDVMVEDGVWIGASCTILPGVVIHEGAVIAAGSVVINDVDSNCLYAGVPAVLKRHLS